MHHVPTQTKNPDEIHRGSIYFKNLNDLLLRLPMALFEE